MVSPDGPGSGAAMPRHDYVYRARLSSVHDGDTLTLVADLGFEVSVRVTVRALGINAPELATPEGKVAQQAALAWVAAAGAGDWPLVIASQKAATPIGPDKYGGRWLAQVWRISDGQELGTALISSGNASPWDGRGTKPVPTVPS